MSSVNMRPERIKADIRELRSVHLMATQTAGKTSPSPPADQPAATAKD